MSYTVEGRLSSAIRDLDDALDDLAQINIEGATENIEEAIRKTKHARNAVKGMNLKCQ